MTHPRVALTLLVLITALLFPRSTAAQNVLCRLQEGLPAPARLIPGTYWNERSVPVEGTTLTLSICVPSSQEIDADTVLDIAEQALPVLDRLTDLRLDGSRTRVFTFDGTLLRELGADGAIDRHNRIVLDGGSLDSTVVHELAHYWADMDRFSELWMVEAYAEYLTHLAMRELRWPLAEDSTPDACATLPLMKWQRDVRGTEFCPYTAGPLVFHDLAAQVGEETLRRVIGEIPRAYGRVDSETLLRELERASGANLSPLMMRRVFGPEHDAWLGARAALHQRYAAATGLAGSIGASLPPSILEDLKSWNDNQVAAALAELEPLLVSAEVVSRRCTELELPCVRPWELSLADPSARASLETLLASTPQLLSMYEQLRVSAGTLGLPTPEGLRQQVALLNDEALVAIQQASGILTTVNVFEERCTHLGLSCRASWQPFWEASDLDSVTNRITRLSLAFDTGTALEARCGDLGARCRELWMRALATGGPAQVQETADELDALLSAGAALEPRCESQAARCRELWREALAQSGVGDAQTLIGDLEQLLTEAERLDVRCGSLREGCAELWQQALGASTVTGAREMVSALDAFVRRGETMEQVCSGAGWSCADGWRASLAAGDLELAGEVLDRQEAALPRLMEAADRVLGGCCLLWMLPYLSAAGADPLAEARSAFARGDVDRAEMLVGELRDGQVRQQLILLAGALVAMIVVAVLAARLVLRRRRGRASAALHSPSPSESSRPVPAPTTTSPGISPDSPLLAQLLATPPDDARL